MNFAGKKAYISNNRANAFVQLQAQRGNQINFASHVPQHIQQVEQPPMLLAPQPQEALLYQHAPPQAPAPQNILFMIPPPMSGSNNLFGGLNHEPRLKM